MHHILVYLCSNLNHTHVGASSECDNANIDIGLCRGGGTLIAAWAVGGNVSIDMCMFLGAYSNYDYFIDAVGVCVPSRCGVPHWREGECPVCDFGNAL